METNKNRTLAMWAGLLASAAWWSYVLLGAGGHHDFPRLLTLGVLPLAAAWSMAWAWSAWHARRLATGGGAATGQAVQGVGPLAEGEAPRSQALVAWFSVGILAAGLLVVNRQVHLSDLGAPRTFFLALAIASFVVWGVYGLLAWAVLRAVRALPAGVPAILASLLIAAGMNYDAHARIGQVRALQAANARAIALLQALQRGDEVGSEQVRQARAGIFGPLLQAQVDVHHAVAVALQTHGDAFEALDLGGMLLPTALASAAAREASMARLEDWRQANSDFHTQAMQAVANYRAATQAAVVQFLAHDAQAFERSMQASATAMADQATLVAQAHGRGVATVAALIRHMDAPKGRYFLDKGPPPRLFFQEDAVLDRYRQLLDQLRRTSEQENVAQDLLAQEGAQQAGRLVQLLEPTR